MAVRDDLREPASCERARDRDRRIGELGSHVNAAMAEVRLEHANERNRQRSLNYFFDADGFFVVRGQLSSEDGAVLAEALQWFPRLGGTGTSTRRSTNMETVRNG